MADKSTSAASSRLTVRRKERAAEKKKEPEVEKKEKQAETGEERETNGGEQQAQNGEGAAANGEAAGGENGEGVVEPMELPPFEIIRGDRIDPFFFKFQFKNVEYSSGRNKTFLCYLVDHGSNGLLLRGYLEDEHTGIHAEEAFFNEILDNYIPKIRYTVTWYVSSSPCAACAAKLVELLKARPSLRLTIFFARLFNWEEPEIQEGLKALAAAGCKLRAMKPLDFVYTWDTFVDGDDQQFVLWEDCQENYEYYQEKLGDVLQ